MSSPFNRRTPESYFAGLRRKDSKNALTTCHGITEKGRACRRALVSPKNSSRFDGIVVITESVEDPAIFFCWQHKDQANAFHQYDEGSVVSIKGRHSLEEAFRSLGLDDVNEQSTLSIKKPSPTAHKTRIPEPAAVVKDQSQPFSRPSRCSNQEKNPNAHYKRKNPLNGDITRSKRKQSGSSRQTSSTGILSLFACCLGITNSIPSDKTSQMNRERHSGSRPVKINRERVDRRGRSNVEMPATIGPRSEIVQQSRIPVDIRRKEVKAHLKKDSAIGITDGGEMRRIVREERQDIDRSKVQSPAREKVRAYRDSDPMQALRKEYQHRGNPKSDSLFGVPGHRPLKSRSKSSPDAQQLQRLHGDWPPPLPPNATDAMRLTYAKLLTTMSEPPSRTDSPGYIYIFWQTDVEQTDDETSAVTSIMSAQRLDHGLKRQETILQQRFFQTSVNAQQSNAEKRKVFLKIGRAANVHWRLNQWKRQCEYEISLLRSYPYSLNGKGEHRKVPNVAKVERLIHLHLEMLGQRVNKQCRCGAEHKEWFEIDATVQGVRKVDEIVRNWVAWSEEKFS
ncbi:uncharacterized protein PV09_00415 [Verruconis gallopava]|uniref:Bacteriophage T5 Orf172 DNA-binding domain-containing protein n=1 Tax=Verruconis gallopava TaxID=253628 RepID=A0A0D1Z9A9_9PEZI|nr:uncharacterized protein PV09_00415 [Verruconis gallopava]KIW09542.1 hypothetical protein PV09_00415 [Verruconis gallopava]